MATPSPSNDPLWAYDTPGWTSQANTGDTIGANLPGVSTAALLAEPAALSGYIARAIDPDTTSAGGTGTTLSMTGGTAYLFAMQVVEPSYTTKVIVGGKTAGTSTHGWAALFNAYTGTQIAITADLTTTQFGTSTTAFNWASGAVIAPGYYYVMLLSVNSVAATLTAFTLSKEAQMLLTSTSCVAFTSGSSLRFATGGTNLTSLSAVPASLTSSMVVSATASASFVGIA